MQEAITFITEHTSKEFGKGGEWVQYGIEKKRTGKIVGTALLSLTQYQYAMLRREWVQINQAAISG